MKIYITGIMGMLGYNTALALKDRCQVTGVDIVDIPDSDIVYRRASLFDEELIRKHILEEKPDVLIHTAAMVNVDRCEEEPDMAEKFNVGVTSYLARICNEQNIKMIYISTDAVFDGNSPDLYTEEDEVHPINVYGQTKLDGEKATLEYPGNLVLRTNIYGRNVQNKKSFGEWIYEGLNNGETLKMFTDIDFSPILVNELAELIYKSMENNLMGIYHACGSGCVTKYRFGVFLKETFAIEQGEIIPTTSDTMQFCAKRAEHMGMSNEKLQKALNIRISTPEESIMKFCELMGVSGHAD